MRPASTPDEVRPDLVGDGYDDEPLLDAREVGRVLCLPIKGVYDLPIPRVRVGLRSIRWRPSVIREFIERRTEAL